MREQTQSTLHAPRRSGGRRTPGGTAAANDRTVTMQFEDNVLLAQLVGDHDRHLLHLERGFDVRLACRGNRIAITGAAQRVELTQATLTELYRRATAGQAVDTATVDTAIRLAAHAFSAPAPRPVTGGLPAMPDTRTATAPASPTLADLPTIMTRRGPVAPRSVGQAEYMAMLARQEMVFGLGPAGTGKTYLAVAQAVAMLQAGQVDRIVLSRPAVEAGERLGFLPGDLKEKIDPYLRPLYDALHDMMPGDQVIRRMGTGEIEVAPLAFMRGRTLAHCFVILDEAQNTTPAQMKMFLTRMGEGTRMVITGDLSQVDLPRGVTSGLREAVDTLDGLPGIGMMRFESRDVVRHPLVARIVEAYDQRAGAERRPHRARSQQENDETSK
ncbi:phosphate starvation-inducible protein PhoH [Komagataeibacter sucrofermentans DSM 15973]|nr:PhoH family protein [Komagataeibacter sucrofermentans]GBQ45785.1 phosphate starvation-inducible protein PhoH [Komagataeibacter sucrofermentans DSM 15973]